MLDIIKLALNDIDKSVDEAKKKVSEHLGEEDLSQKYLEQLSKEVKGLNENIPVHVRNEQHAFTLLSTLNGIDGICELLNDYFKQQAESQGKHETFQTLSKFFWQNVWSKVKSTFKVIWSYITKMLVPKSWKFTGKFSSPLIGFAETGIEINFG